MVMVISVLHSSSLKGPHAIVIQNIKLMFALACFMKGVCIDTCKQQRQKQHHVTEHCKGFKLMWRGLVKQCYAEIAAKTKNNTK